MLQNEFLEFSSGVALPRRVGRPKKADAKSSAERNREHRAREKEKKQREEERLEAEKERRREKELITQRRWRNKAPWYDPEKLRWEPRAATSPTSAPDRTWARGTWERLSMPWREPYSPPAGVLAAPKNAQPDTEDGAVPLLDKAVDEAAPEPERRPAAGFDIDRPTAADNKDNGYIAAGRAVAALFGSRRYTGSYAYSGPKGGPWRAIGKPTGFAHVSRSTTPRRLQWCPDVTPAPTPADLAAIRVRLGKPKPDPDEAFWRSLGITGNELLRYAI